MEYRIDCYSELIGVLPQELCNDSLFQLIDSFRLSALLSVEAYLCSNTSEAQSNYQSNTVWFITFTCI